MSDDRIIRIGGGSAGYGDGAMASPVLIRDGALDYLMLDYLSEIYMPMAARARAADPAAGYVPYFPEDFYGRIAAGLHEKNVKLVTNAGAVNPHACAEAMRAVAARLGLSPRIAVVDGDDLLARAKDLRAAGTLTTALPEGGGYTGIHAYLGAFPIAHALALGADIVITGRVVDSALALGPLIHEFGWAPDDYDRLAAGSLIGHILECGAQASGGLFTDWREIGDYADIGYPIAEVAVDGSAVITKAPGTGGLVSAGSVAEQLVYEIGDPASYRLPDVTVDFTQVRFEQIGEDRVAMTGARGRSPGVNYKAIATWDDGWAGSFGFFMRGPAAAEKARANAASVLKRAETMLLGRNLPPIRRSHVEVIGQEASYGAHAHAAPSREIFCRLSVEVEEPSAFGLLRQEANTGMISMTPGMASTMMISPPAPMARLEAFLIPADTVPARVMIDGHGEEIARFAHEPFTEALSAMPIAAPALPSDTVVPLVALAWTRSGDKGDACNVGVVARRPDYLPYIAAAMDAATVADRYAAMFADGFVVRRYHLPGANALNFVLEGALDGGCSTNLRFDAMGKSASQDVLDLPIPIPSSLLTGA